MVLLDLTAPPSVLLGRFGVGPDDVCVEGRLERLAGEADDLGSHASVGERHVASLDQRTLMVSLSQRLHRVGQRA